MKHFYFKLKRLDLNDCFVGSDFMKIISENCKELTQFSSSANASEEVNLDIAKLENLQVDSELTEFVIITKYI